MGKSADIGGEMGLTYSFISLPLQIVIMLVMGLISILCWQKQEMPLFQDKDFKD
jgi:hypothetical protein